MADIHIVWDIEDDPNGNVQHIAEHDVTMEEVEQVLHSGAKPIISRSTGSPMVFGETTTGKYIVVVYEEVQRDPKMIYPRTAYPVPRPRARKKR